MDSEAAAAGLLFPVNELFRKSKCKLEPDGDDIVERSPKGRYIRVRYDCIIILICIILVGNLVIGQRVELCIIYIVVFVKADSV